MFSKDHILSSQKKRLEVRQTHGKETSGEADAVFHKGSDKDLN